MSSKAARFMSLTGGSQKWKGIFIRHRELRLFDGEKHKGFAKLPRGPCRQSKTKILVQDMLLSFPRRLTSFPKVWMGIYYYAKDSGILSAVNCFMRRRQPVHRGNRARKRIRQNEFSISSGEPVSLMWIRYDTNYFPRLALVDR